MKTTHKWQQLTFHVKKKKKTHLQQQRDYVFQQTSACIINTSVMGLLDDKTHPLLLCT